MALQEIGSVTCATLKRVRSGAHAAMTLQQVKSVTERERGEAIAPTESKVLRGKGRKEDILFVSEEVSFGFRSITHAR